MSHRAWLAAICASAIVMMGGCVAPIARQVYEPNPVRAERATVYVHEIRRGPLGGVITLRVQNTAAESLEWARGTEVDIQVLDGTLARNLTAHEFDKLIVEYGPRCMGYGYWPTKSNIFLATLDRRSPRVDLDCGESILLEVAFLADPTVRNTTLNLSRALSWRTANGRTVECETPILVNIDLPVVPEKKQPNLELFSKMRVGVELSSDM